MIVPVWFAKINPDKSGCHDERPFVFNFAGIFLTTFGFSCYHFDEQKKKAERFFKQKNMKH
jgi:hypothetical protein